MTAHVLQGFDRLTAGLAVRPERTFLAALALILAGAIVGATPDRGGVVLGGASGWVLWFAGMAILAIWLLLVLAGRPISALLIAGGVSALSGAFLFYNPEAGALAVAILVISALVMDGGIQLTLALKLRPATVWRWLFASALASAVAAVVLSRGALAGSSAGWGPLLGLALATTGLALLLLRRADGADSSQGRSRLRTGT